MYQEPLDSQLLLRTIVSVPGQTTADRAAAISALEAQKSTGLVSNITERLRDGEQKMEILTQQHEQANKLHEEHNNLLQLQIEELKKQAEDLKRESELQAKEIREEKRFQRRSFWITTAIAGLALLVSVIGLFFK